MKRFLIIAGLLIAGIIGITAYLVVTSLGSLVKAAIEKYGSEITRTTVSLSSVEAKPREAELLLRGLRIRNPAGFQSPYFFEAQSIKAVMDLSTITADTIVIKEIQIDGPVVTYELGPTGSNITALRQNIESPARQDQRNKEGVKSKPKQKLVIDHIRLRGGRVKLVASVLRDSQITVALRDIHLKDVGRGKGGVVPKEMAAEIIRVVSGSVGSAIREVKLEKLLDGQAKSLPRAREILEAVQDAIPKDTKRAAKELKKLFHH